MKKILLLVSLLLIGIEVYAQDPQNYVIIDQPTNVRSGPSRHFEVRSVAYQGTLTVTGKTDFDSSQVCTGIYEIDRDKWLRVDFEGVEGWVKLCVVDFVGEIDSLSVSEAIAPLRHRPKNFVLYYRVASSYLADELGAIPSDPNVVATTRYRHINLRNEPRIDGEIIEILTAEKVYIIGRNVDSTWLYVTYFGVSPFDEETWWRGSKTQTGWVAGYLISKPDGWQDVIPIVES